MNHHWLIVMVIRCNQTMKSFKRVDCKSALCSWITNYIYQHIPVYGTKKQHHLIATPQIVLETSHCDASHVPWLWKLWLCLPSMKSLWKMVHLRMIYQKMYLLKVTMLIFMWFDDDYTYVSSSYVHIYIYVSVWYLNISWLIHHIMVWEYVQIWYVLPMFVGSTQIRFWKNPVCLNRWRRDAFVSPCPILETLQISILYCIYIQYVHVHKYTWLVV